MSCFEREARRVEEASLNAWPALSQLLLDGWLVRMTRGFTKRANSVTPIYPSLAAVGPKVVQCEHLYAGANLRTVFRLPSLVAPRALDTLLDDRGYRLADPTEVMRTTIRPGPDERDGRVTQIGQSAWLTLYAQLTGQSADTARLQRLIIGAIPTPCLFLAAHAGNTPVACGLAVLDGGLVGVFDVVTASAHRRQGLAEAIVLDALARGGERGARAAYLQVVESNTPARRLYSRLGFERLYRYWYRVSTA